MTVQPHRNAPSIWSSPPSGDSPTYSTDPTTSFQLVLQDDELTYDAVDNPVHIRDWRNPAEWPVGSKPASRTMQYDDLNRVTRIDYQYHDGSNSQGNDDWISPFENENTGANVDSRRAMPSPHVSFSKRVLSQTMQYDWLGNQTATDDDAHGFYDRSLGSVTNNTANDKPYQLTGAQQTTGAKTGSLEAEYDVTGNLVDMAVIRDGDCLPSGAVCSQRFVYDWDEVGRLMRARRWDMASPSVQDSIPSSTPAADLRHSYDASDSRVIKTAVDENEESSYTVYIFGTLELRRTSFDTSGTPDDYTDDIDTEVGYLFGHGVRLARLHWEDSGSPVLGGANLHVLFELGDHLGSSSKVLDKATCELVESSTYMGYGQAESDYRPGRWKGVREDYRFTGKEEDSEVGLTYFGKRFMSSALGRWVSADPLAVHGRVAEPNVYSYIAGSLLRLVDRTGLVGEEQIALGSDLGNQVTKMSDHLKSIGVRGSAVYAFDNVGWRETPDLETSGSTADSFRAKFKWDKDITALYSSSINSVLISKETASRALRAGTENFVGQGLGSDARESLRRSESVLIHEVAHSWFDSHFAATQGTSAGKWLAVAQSYYRKEIVRELSANSRGLVDWSKSQSEISERMDALSRGYLDEAVCGFLGRALSSADVVYKYLSELQSEGTLSQSELNTAREWYNKQTSFTTNGYIANDIDKPIVYLQLHMTNDIKDSAMKAFSGGTVHREFDNSQVFDKFRTAVGEQVPSRSQ